MEYLNYFDTKLQIDATYRYTYKFSKLRLAELFWHDDRQPENEISSVSPNIDLHLLTIYTNDGSNFELRTIVLTISVKVLAVINPYFLFKSKSNDFRNVYKISAITINSV